MQIDFPSIIAFILLVAVILLGRRQQRHGVTGVDRALVNEHGRLKDRIAAVEALVGGCATKGDFAVLSAKIDALEEHAASSGEINALEGKINVIGERVEGMKEMTSDTRDSVRVIERILMNGRLDR